MKVNLKALWKIISLCFVTTLCTQHLLGQSPCPNSNCVSGDIRITEVKLVQNDAPTYSALPNSCNPNQLNVPVALKVTFDVTSQTRYGFLVVADIWITDPNSANPTTPYKAGRIAKCFEGTFSQGLQVKYVSTYINSSNIIWPCGSTIQLKDVYTAWDNQVATASHPSVCTHLNETTGAITTQSCKSIAPKCKFYGSNESITVVSPLIVNYTYSGSCPAGNLAHRISFTNTTTGGVLPYTFVWNFGDGTATSSATNPTHDYASAGNYTVRLTATDNSQPNQTFFIDKTVTVASCCTQSSFTTNPAAVAQCTGTSASFTVATSGGNPAPTIQWQEKVGAGAFTNIVAAGVYTTVTSTTLNISNIAGLNGNEYRAVLTNGACTSVNSTAATLTVYPKPTAGISGTTAVCRDATQPNVTFSGSGGTTPYTFNYTLNGSPATISTTGANTSVTLAASTATATTLTYALTGVSDANCSNTASGSAVVTVNAPPNAPGVSVTPPTCGNANGTVTVTSPLDDGTIDYQYKNNAGEYTDNVAFTVAANAGYSIVVRNKGTGCISTATTGTMGSQGSAPATPQVSVKTPASCSSSSITLEVTSPVGAYEYRNNNGNWQSSKEFVIQAGAGYSIQARSTSDITCISIAATCAAESNRSAIVQQSEKTALINIPGEETSVKAYPNPFSDKINFVVTNAESRKGTLEVYNLSGQRLATVYNGIIPAGTQVFELRMPVRQVAELIYVLNLGNKKVTGKVLQVR